jgi:hypothetical protein
MDEVCSPAHLTSRPRRPAPSTHCGAQPGQLPHRVLALTLPPRTQLGAEARSRKSTQAQTDAEHALAAELEDVLWKYGGVTTAAAGLTLFLEKPSVQALQQFISTCPDSLTYASKDMRAQADIILNFRTFFEHFKSSTRTVADQAAVDCAVAALVSETKAGTKGMGKAYRRLLGLSHRMLRRGIAVREEMMETETSHWKRKERAGKAGTLSMTGRELVSDILHGPEWSKPANDKPGEKTVVTGEDEDGRALYVKHTYRNLLFPIAETKQRLTGVDRDGQPTKDGPHEDWKQIMALTATEKNPRGMKGSCKLLRDIVKGCCFVNEAPSICVCTLCYTLRRGFATWHRFRNGKKGWHRTKCTAACGVAGLCTDEMSLYRTFTGSLEGALAAMMCPPVRRPELEIDEYDPCTKSPTGKKVPFSIPPKKCHGVDGECKTCGWDNLTKGFPINEVSATVLSAESGTGGKKRMGKSSGAGAGAAAAAAVPRKGTEVRRTFKVQCCPNDVGGFAVVLHAFRKVLRPPSGAAETDAEWLPTGSTRGKEHRVWLPFQTSAGGAVHMIAGWTKEALAHSYALKMNRQVGKIKYDTFITKVCLGLGKEWALWAGLLTVDWTAALSHHHGAEATCEYASVSNAACAVLHVPDGMHTEASIRAEAPRKAKRLRKKLGEGFRMIKVKTIVVFFHCKRKGSALYLGAVLRDLAHILNRGALPEGSRAEAFFMGERLMGSRTEGNSLDRTYRTGPADDDVIRLRDRATRVWLLPGGADSGHSVTHIVQQADGCAEQFECLHAYHLYQRLAALLTHELGTTFTFEATKDIVGHGKGEADGAAKTGPNALNKYNRLPDNSGYGDGTREYALCLAAVNQGPVHRTDAAGASNPGSHNVYVTVIYPDDGSAFDTKLATAENGFRGSSSKNFKRPMGGSSTEEYNPLGPRLMVQDRACGCSTCVRANVLGRTLAAYSECKMRSEFPAPKLVNIESAKPSVVAERVSRVNLGTFAADLHVGSVVVVRAAVDDADNTANEPFFLARLTKKPEKLTKAATYAAEKFPRGWWLCRIRWFWFQNEDEDGMRQYQHKDEVPVDIPFGVNCFDPRSCKLLVDKGDNFKAGDPAGDVVYMLGFEEYEAILSNGDLVS